MKKALFIFGLIILMNSILTGQVQNIVSIKYPGYTLSVPVQLMGYNEADLVPLVVGKLDSLPMKSAQSRFGILFRDDSKNLADVNILEILDSGTGKSIRKVNLDEYYNGKDESIKFYKEISILENEALPEGKMIAISFLIEPTKSMKVKVRFTGRVEGSIVQNISGFVISNSEPLTQIKPAVLFHVSSTGTVRLDIVKKGKQQSVVIATNPISIEPGQKSKVLTFNIAGSSISFNKYIPRQIEGMKKYFTENKVAPNVAIITVSEKLKIAPRDTMTYIIYYHNIGTAPATDINIAGPIPAGTKYLEGSAVAQIKDAEIDVDRKKMEPQQVGDVLRVKWIDKSKIKPGEERWVQYSVVVD